MNTQEIKFTVSYDDVPIDPIVETSHGFSCLIEGVEGAGHQENGRLPLHRYEPDRNVPGRLGHGLHPVRLRGDASTAAPVT